MKVGLIMKDKRLEYRISVILKSRGIPFEILEDGGEEDIILSDFKEGSNVIRCVKVNDVRKVVPYIYGKNRFYKLVIGIDPGPRPGLVVLGDGEIVEEIQLKGIEGIREEIDEIYEGYSPERVMVKIGNGDIVNRNRIVNSIIDKYPVELVDEKNTSKKNTNKNIESARVIAFSRGREIRGKVNTVVKEGYIRDVQRKSRIESRGRITISRELAKKVALGYISLERAIEITRDKDEK